MKSPMRSLLPLLGLGIGLVGCSSSDDPVLNPPNPEPLEVGRVRFIHASPDAPNVNIAGTASTFSEDLGFKQATEFLEFAAGTVSVQVDAIVPGGEATVIGPVDLAITADTEYSVIAAGDTLAIGPIVLSNASTPVDAGSVRAQVVHAAPDAPQVDVFVTAPGAALDQSVPLGSFVFSESLGPVVVPAGDYQIRVTLPNTPNTVVFDSGTVSLAGGSDLLVVAVENTLAGNDLVGSSPISLFVATPDASLEIVDQATPAEVRVIHASPDAPSVDIIVNDDFANPVLSGVPYAAFSGYLALPPDTYNVKVTPEGNAGLVVIDADLELAAGQQYSVYATGPLASISPFVTLDDDRSLATAAKVRILHLAPSAGLVDIYVTAPGADIADVSPAFAAVDFQVETGYVSLAGGMYDVTVTVADTKTAAIGPATITIADGGVYTAAARDAVGGGAPFGLILLDDFTP